MKGRDTRPADVPILALENSLGYLIRDTHRLVSKLLNSRIERIGISVGQWYILRALSHEEGLTQRDLSSRIGMNEPNVVTALRDLEKRDIIRRKVDKQDGRCKRVSLTDTGRELTQSLLPIVEEVNDIIASPLKEKERAKLLSLVQRVHAGLEQKATE